MNKRGISARANSKCEEPWVSGGAAAGVGGSRGRMDQARGVARIKSKSGRRAAGPDRARPVRSSLGQYKADNVHFSQQDFSSMVLEAPDGGTVWTK